MLTRYIIYNIVYSIIVYPIIYSYVIQKNGLEKIMKVNSVVSFRDLHYKYDPASNFTVLTFTDLSTVTCSPRQPQLLDLCESMQRMIKVTRDTSARVGSLMPTTMRRLIIDFITI